VLPSRIPKDTSSAFEHIIQVINHHYETIHWTHKVRKKIIGKTEEKKRLFSKPQKQYIPRRHGGGTADAIKIKFDAIVSGVNVIECGINVIVVANFG
jgi:hypothetical protein